MPRFFVDSSAVRGDKAYISGDDASHISKSLRMRKGEKLILCDGCGTDFECTIENISDGLISLNVDGRTATQSEPKCKVTLFQGMPKSDKLEFIVEKAVEIGAVNIVPVLTSRCVARPDEKSAARKAERLSRHALEAAKQCGRGIIPQVGQMIDFAALTAQIKDYDKTIVFYEGGGEPIKNLVDENTESVAVIVGPEGGLAQEEVEKLCAAGAAAGTLGKRILRTETAAVVAVTTVLTYTGDME